MDEVNDGDAELGLGAEALDEVLGFDGAGGGLVGDLAAEGVAFVEDVAADADDAVGVGVGLGEDEGLGHPLATAAGEKGVVEVVAVGFEDGSYLVVGDDGAAEFVCAVFEVVFDGVGFLDVAVAVEELKLGAGGQAGAFGADAVGDVVDVDFIEDGLPVGVAADGVLVEEGFGIEGGGGGEADDEGVEVVEDLLPFVVDGAVAFIDDDEVEGLGGKVGLVGDFDGFAGGEVAVEGGALVFVVVDGFGVAFELGEEALDGGDDDLVDGIEAGGAEVADVVDFGEELAGVGGGVGVELALGLGAEGVAVDEEEDALEAGELEEAVDFGDGGEGFAGTGGHVDEGAGAGGGEGGLEAGDGFVLAIAEGLGGAGQGGVQRVRGGEGGEAAAEGIVGSFGLLHQLAKRLGLREVEDWAGARLGVAGVGELDLAAVGFEAEWEWVLPAGGGVLPAAEDGIRGGLFLNAFKGVFRALGFEDAAGLAVEVEDVVGSAGVARGFTQRSGLTAYRGTRRGDMPACRPQLGVDKDPSRGFRRFQGLKVIAGEGASASMVIGCGNTVVASQGRHMEARLRRRDGRRVDCITMIRPFHPQDLPRLKEITTICFEGVSIDRNIERQFGHVGGHDWAWRKGRHIDADVAPPNDEGVFVYEDAESGEVIGYITCRIDPNSKIGQIPNLAVHPSAQGQGIGKELMQHAFDYFQAAGMELAKIETLDQNPVGQQFYPQMGFQEVARQIHYVKPLS